MMFSHLHTPPVPPSQHNPNIAPHIEQAILKALAKERHERHADIAAFLEALQVPSIEGEILTYRGPISLSDEDRKKLSQNSTILPTVASGIEIPLLATQLDSNSRMQVTTDQEENEKYSVQQVSRESSRLKQRRIFVALTCVLILAVVMIPFLFQVQPSGTKGTLAVAPPMSKTTPLTQPRRHSTRVHAAEQTPQATAIVLPQSGVVGGVTEVPTTIGTDTPGAIPTAKSTNTPGVTPTDTPVSVPTPTDTPIVTPTDTPVPTNTPIVTPTDTPVPTPTDTPVVTPTDTPIVTPTDTPITG
jgi:hypothetical protein